MPRHAGDSGGYQGPGAYARNSVTLKNNRMRCGAKTRSGAPCIAPAMPNGRCRMHGGPSTGAPLGNGNAVTHGIYRSLLTDQERTDYDGLELGGVDHELRLVRVRLARALKAEKDAIKTDRDYEASWIA